MTDHESSTRNTVAFILPLISFLLIAQLYPNFSKIAAEETDPAVRDSLMTTATWRYVILVALQVLVASGLIVYFRKVYLRHFPLRVSLLSVGVGIVGVIAWIGISELRLEEQFFESVGWTALISVRSGFNPFESIEAPWLRHLFLVFRFSLLALLVPIIEELFLRGWLVRWVHDPNWESVQLDHLSWSALLAPTVYGVLTHPTEAIAAMVWFSLVTWLMYRTGNLWDCVVAHAVTNLLLGIYVVRCSAWYLW